jgi:hypothetical protein
MVDLVERFQTLVVGITGFAGVIASLVVNAWLARRQQAQRVEHERDVLRTALRAELGVLTMRS